MEHMNLTIQGLHLGHVIKIKLSWNYPTSVTQEVVNWEWNL